MSSLALNCSAPRRSLPPDSCLLPPSASTANFDDSQHRCIEEGFTGLSVVTDQQFANLALYAQVLGKQNQFYWLGYSYDAQSVLRDVSQRVVANDSAIALPANYGQPLLDASPGMCIAIDGNGMLHRRPCADLLSSFCQVLVQGEGGREGGNNIRHLHLLLSFPLPSLHPPPHLPFPPPTPSPLPTSLSPPSFPTFPSLSLSPPSFPTSPSLSLSPPHLPLPTHSPPSLLQLPQPISPSIQADSSRTQ